MHVKLFRPGPWQAKLEEIAGSRKPGDTLGLPGDVRAKRLRYLEQENKKLRRAISGLMLDKLILANAAAGTL